MTHLAFPYAHDRRGRTAQTPDFPAHVRELVEQTLLTAPGERVNRPDFGAGLLDMVFEPGSETLVEAAEFLTRSALQRFLQDVVLIEDLRVAMSEGLLTVDLTYLVIETGEREAQTVTRLI
ncbi:GPW/gp25 family protein [Flavimaricola marinus]|uniref:Gene 25-like lysozyme n=1 Tax=Flavimaricola marinus TaxID=1819565 RepID=A0A238LBG6_9RHOB|nr:GPW/gp25 family protein [Flavimaricola marinus]SMY06260.1 Gene 25-like lysozyme [Flavimaricola marinus]